MIYILTRTPDYFNECRLSSMGAYGKYDFLMVMYVYVYGFME